jgi:hypothetical protein
MAARKRKIHDEGDLLAVTEEELANASDSDAELSSSSSSSSCCVWHYQDKSWLAQGHDRRS